MASSKIMTVINDLRIGAKAKLLAPSSNSILSPKTLEQSTGKGNTRFIINQFDSMGAFGTIFVKSKDQEQAFNFTYTTTKINGNKNQSISLRSTGSDSKEALTVRSNAKKVLPETIKALEKAVHDLIILHKSE